MREAGWGTIFVLGLTAAVAVVLVVVIWQLFKTRHIQATIGAGEEYRRIAEQVAAVRRGTGQDGPRIDTTSAGRDDAEEGR